MNLATASASAAAHHAETTDRARWEGIRRLVDPKISLASVASMVLGAAVAGHEGPLAWGWLALTVFGILSIEVAKNASGELADFRSGVDQAVDPEDRSPFSGGKRVLVEGLLTPRQTAVVSWIGYGLGILAGVALAAYRHPDVLWLGIVGVGLAYFYHADPLRLSYRGLGEAAVALTYGPLIACGTFLVQRREWGDQVWWLSVPLGILIGAFLWINEFPDYRADRGGGKRTLIVRLGPHAASRFYVALIGVAYALLLFLPAAGLTPAVWLGVAGLPFSVWAARRLRHAPGSTSQIIPAQACTLLAFLAYSIGAGIGILLGPSR
jgi:1,4-dihydroxy-2-naphthoate octaprenyltransferase